MRRRPDWRNARFDWNHARAFLVTAENGSLSAAARALGTTQPTLGRQVAALEEELGVELFVRGGRGLELTPTGLELVEHVRAMSDAASRVSLAAAGLTEAVEGTVCISGSEVMAAFVLPSLIATLRGRHPAIEIALVASNATSDLRRREADIAIRLVEPNEPDLIARRLGVVSGNVYGTPAYLASIGNPSTPEGFEAAHFIGFGDNQRALEILREAGFPLGPHSFPVSSDSRLAQWELVKRGLGLGLMQEDVGDAEPAVRRALLRIERLRGPIWLVAHRELRKSRRIRVVFDFLAEELSARYSAGADSASDA